MSFTRIGGNRKKNEGGPVDKNRVGEERKNNRGQNMRITEYRNSKDMDVVFDDGTVREHITYGNFVRGTVAKKKYADRTSVNIGDEGIANNGLRMKVTDIYREGAGKPRRLEVTFEDGADVRGITAAAFHKREVAHPELKRNRECSYRGFTNIKHSLSLSDGRVFYEVTNSEGVRRIASPQLMIKISSGNYDEDAVRKKIEAITEEIRSSIKAKNEQP